MKTPHWLYKSLIGAVLLGTAHSSVHAAGVTEENIHAACIIALEQACTNLPEPEQTFCEGTAENLETICDIAATQAGLVLDLARAHGDAVIATKSASKSVASHTVSATLGLVGSLNVPGGPAVAICTGRTSDADDINLSCASGGTVIKVSPTLAFGIDPTVTVPTNSTQKICSIVTGRWNDYPYPITTEACITANDLVMSPGVPIP